jgi:hypothetical protein
MAATPPATSSAHAPSPALRLAQVNPDVYRVHLSGGQHVGNLNRVGTVWKFKAIGYDAAGAVEPGGGPLTSKHNTVFDAPDAIAITLQLAPDKA